MRIIRPGYYQHKHHQIERQDEQAEVYPEQDYYKMWRIYSPNGDAWLYHAGTLKDAVSRIDEVMCPIKLSGR